MIILTSKGGLFNSHFLKKAKTFEDSLKKLHRVQGVFSPLSQKHLVNGPTGLLAFPLLHIENEAQLKRDSARIFQSPFYQNSFSSNGQSMVLFLVHDHIIEQTSSQELLDNIANAAEFADLNSIKLVGKLYAQTEFARLIGDDFARYLIGSLVVSMILLLVIFRSFNSAILPFVISILSLVWLFGLMSVLKVQINLLSSLIPPIIFFASMSDAIHFANAFHKSQAKDVMARIKDAFGLVLVPTVLTSVTTAIGFLSLLQLQTIPFQSLGIFAAIGIVLAFLITFTIGPIIISFSKSREKKVALKLPANAIQTLKEKKWLISGMVIIMTLFLIPGIFKLEVDAYLLDDLPSDSEVTQSFKFADESFHGTKPYEIRVSAKGDRTIWDNEVMREIEKINRYLENEYPVAMLQSAPNLLKYLNQSNNGGLTNNYTYPDTDIEYHKAIQLSRRIDQRVINRLVSKDEKVTRLTGFIPEYGSKATERNNQKMLSSLNAEIDHSLIEYQITGTTLLIDKSHTLLSQNLMRGILTAIIIVGFILGFYFKSTKLLIISLIPNLIPLLVVAGVIGWMGIPLKMSTVIIFTIAFGIAVDDTIHLMGYYLRKRTKNLEAMEDTFHHAGSAILITSLIMIAGFSIFLLSEFGGTFYLGLFACLTLLVALIIDLTILPLLLLRYKRNA